MTNLVGHDGTHSPLSILCLPCVVSRGSYTAFWWLCLVVTYGGNGVGCRRVCRVLSGITWW